MRGLYRQSIVAMRRTPIAKLLCDIYINPDAHYKSLNLGVTCRVLVMEFVNEFANIIKCRFYLYDLCSSNCTY